MNYNDNTIINFGSHRNKSLKDVPDDYLIKFWNRHKASFENGTLFFVHTRKIMEYIQDNLDSLDVDKIED